MFPRISKIFVVSIMLIALGVCQAIADTEANKAIALRVVDLWNTGDLSIADEIFTADFVKHDPNTPNVTDVKSYKTWAVETLTAFPDFHVEVNDMIAEGDYVAWRWTDTGTHNGVFLGIPPTGKKVMFTGMLIHRFSDGKIAEDWWSFDGLGLLQQIGVVPAMGSVDFAWGEPSKATGAPGDPEENKALVRRVIDEIFNQGELEVVDEIIATDYVFHNPTNSVSGIDGYKQFVATLRTAFPDIQFTIEDLIAEGDKVVCQYWYTATFKGEYLGIPPTGKQATVTGIMISRFADGKIVEDWESADALGLLMQLGVIPPMTPVDTEANKAIALRLVDLWNTGDLTIADEIFSADLTNHDPNNPQVNDLKSYKAWLAEIRTGWPDFNVEDHDLVAEGDKVVARWTVTGTHKGEFMGIPPTGNKGMTTGMHIYRFADGKIAEHWWTWDVLGNMQQLGVIPAMGRVDFAWGEPSEVTGAPGDPEENKAIVRRAIDEIWNQGKLEAIDEFISKDYIRHGPTNSVIGTDGYKQFFAMTRSAIPDFRVTIEDIIAEGDKVAARLTFTGTQKGEYMGIPPTGKYATVTGIYIVRIADGKNVDEWESIDTLGLLQQLGAIPSMTPEDFSNVFFMPLAKGLNMISLPLKPATPYTARSLAKQIGATVVIRYNESSGRFGGFDLSAPDDGFSIEGGKGYIVNVSKDSVVAFTGAAWTNQPPVKGAPIAQTTSAWAFVVSGFALDGEAMSARDGDYNVMVRNLRTGDVATETVDSSGYFAAAYADLSRRAVIATGDKVEVSVVDSSGNIASGPFVHKVTPNEIRNAVVNIQLRLGDIIPTKSLLLQNFPNPFNPETWIPYQLKEDSEVKISIYNASGQLIRALNLGHKPAGLYTSQSRSAYWDGRNDAGERVSSGVYFYQLSAGDYHSVKKMVIVK